jgi:hypothetical protein
MGLEKFIKDGLIYEMQFVNDAFYRHIGILEHIFGFKNDKGIYPIRG